jgi:hypothetical protein
MAQRDRLKAMADVRRATLPETLASAFQSMSPLDETTRAEIARLDAGIEAARQAIESKRDVTGLVLLVVLVLAALCLLATSFGTLTASLLNTLEDQVRREAGDPATIDRRVNIWWALVRGAGSLAVITWAMLSYFRPSVLLLYVAAGCAAATAALSCFVRMTPRQGAGDSPSKPQNIQGLCDADASLVASEASSKKRAFGWGLVVVMVLLGAISKPYDGFAYTTAHGMMQCPGLVILGAVLVEPLLLLIVAAFLIKPRWHALLFCTCGLAWAIIYGGFALATLFGNPLFLVLVVVQGLNCSTQLYVQLCLHRWGPESVENQAIGVSYGGLGGMVGAIAAGVGKSLLPAPWFWAAGTILALLILWPSLLPGAAIPRAG